MRLTGPGSQLPPAADRADRSAADPQFFTAQLWLMEHGSLQVRIAVDGARGHAMLAVPVPAVAQRTLAMTPGLGVLLLALMLLLANALVAIAAGAAREATLDPGEEPTPRVRRRARWAAIAAAIGVTALLALGNAWWNSEARNYARMVQRPWQVHATVSGCELAVENLDYGPTLLPDHGHEMHLF